MPFAHSCRDVVPGELLRAVSLVRFGVEVVSFCCSGGRVHPGLDGKGADEVLNDNTVDSGFVLSNALLPFPDTVIFEATVTPPKEGRVVV